MGGKAVDVDDEFGRDRNRFISGSCSSAVVDETILCVGNFFSRLLNFVVLIGIGGGNGSGITNFSS